MSQAPVQVLGENRHHCHGCGSCCFGHAIELVDAEEQERIERIGAELGVADPVVDGQLRYEAHRCVFHDEDRLCRIHKTHGLEAKPLRCQLWPLKLVRTEDGLRFGLDPGCLNTWRSWQVGEVQEPVGRMVARPGAMSPPEARAEEQLLGLASVEGATVAGLLHVLAGGRDLAAAELPDGMAARIAVRARATRFGQLLGKGELGDGIRDPLAHLPAFLDGLDPEAPPPFAGRLTQEQDAFVREVLRRKLWLREAPVAPATHGLFVITLMGAVVCAWADPAPDTFGPALAAWTRLMRFQAFWLRVAPELEILRWICTGAYAGQLSPDVVVGRSQQDSD